RKRQLPAEPPQTEMRSKVIDNAPVPMDSIYLAFRMCGRTDADYYTTDLLSDVLSNGASSRFYQRLLKDRQLFSAIDCYISGTIDPGLFIIEGKPAEGISLEEAEDAIWSELALVRNELVEEEELQKVKNKVESSLLFSEMSVLNKAINLAFFELLGDADLINQEIDAYRKVQREDILRVANDILRKENCCRLIYRAKQG
ncbi:MAG: insulinase family protein, partial [Bacteroidetes bacterium]